MNLSLSYAYEMSRSFRTDLITLNILDEEYSLLILFFSYSLINF
jgi:hypothetical protein